MHAAQQQHVNKTFHITAEAATCDRVREGLCATYSSKRRCEGKKTHYLHHVLMDPLLKAGSFN